MPFEGGTGTWILVVIRGKEKDPKKAGHPRCKRTAIGSCRSATKIHRDRFRTHFHLTYK